jgi:hypothetical protein
MKSYRMIFDLFCAVAADPVSQVFPPIRRDSLDQRHLTLALVLALGRTRRDYGRRAQVQRRSGPAQSRTLVIALLTSRLVAITLEPRLPQQYSMTARYVVGFSDQSIGQSGTHLACSTLFLRGTQVVDMTIIVQYNITRKRCATREINLGQSLN